MSRNRVAKAAFLLVASVSMAAAQKTPPILVLQMPADANPDASKAWNSNLSFNYNGRLGEDRKIWVRVFRGSKQDLQTMTPRLTPRNKCAVYAQMVVLSVGHRMDGQLRVGDLQDFFEMVRQQRQVFTLVFEEGGDPSHSDALYLEKKDKNISDYFGNGIEVTLTSDPDLDARWHSEAAAELAASHPPPKSWFDRVFGIEPTVQAATTAQPADQRMSWAGAPYQEPPKPEPHCQSVQPVAFRAQLENPSSPNTTQEALAPLFLRQNTACGE